MGVASLRVLTGGALFALVAPPAAAHVGNAADSPFGVGALLALLLAGASLLYVRGVVRLWRRAGAARGISTVDVARFALGMVVLGAALLSPIDAVADRSFAMHMLEHEMLMVLAAPLFVVSRPLEAFAWALAPRARHATTMALRASPIRALWRATTTPVSATAVHALALWVWHLPVLFAAALASESVHVLQHACFFGSALAFWWAMFGGASRKAGVVSLACLFATMLHTSALGALLTFAPSAWYVATDAPRLFALTSLEDQQLGGLIMWVPGGLAYVVVGLAIVATWLATPRRASHDAARHALSRR
ncbi:MAG TPA: cytochrome c oxidase assembly protein [Casimicrobiaceae bacterium]|nr:cytochrome c oxidase assembly protein [Casimicrobiaceae bacterium]